MHCGLMDPFGRKAKRKEARATQASFKRPAEYSRVSSRVILLAAVFIYQKRPFSSPSMVATWERLSRKLN